jgi:hypothetical protein
MPKSKTHSITLEFDNKESAERFRSHWLDGGGDGGGNIDWDTVSWNKQATKMRIKGTGHCIVWIDGEMVLDLDT